MKKSALVVGLGLSGLSAAEFLLQEGWQVAATDKNISKALQNPEVKLLMSRGVPILDEHENFCLDSFQLAVLSPGVHPDQYLVKKIKEAQIECIGEAELAFRFLKQPVIGITGTNGKTTVTLLIEHALDHAGIHAAALGNVGVPLARNLHNVKEGTVICAELSSFQLETMQKRICDCAIILNITPDHLDRYKDMQEYAQAKAKIAQVLKPEGKLFVEERCYNAYKELLPKDCVERYGYDATLECATDLKGLYRYGQKLADLPKSLQGKKSIDLENYMAAFMAVSCFGVSAAQFNEAYTSFCKPHHRIEFVREVNGVQFINDSKGTNIDAVIRAVEAIEQPIHLIAGGVHKGSSYTPWIEPFAGKVKKVFAIGEAAPIIRSTLHAHLPVELCSSLEEAVLKSYKEAKKGEVVLLSPGCSSFDMFRDYAHRGDEFVRIVKGVSK
jgi:UDP-N-acetylmuramoylalanine--D-glutamate ligase